MNNVQWREVSFRAASRWLYAAILAGCWALSGDLHAAEVTDEIKALREQMQQLEQKIRTLEERATAEDQPGPGKPKPAPTVSIGANGLVVRSADSNFLMNVHGYAQVDGRFYVGGGNSASDTFLLRRARPIIEGTVYDKYDYRLMFDFGSGNVNGSSAGNVALLDDAFVNARFWPFAQLQIGKFKSPVGLERLQSTAELFFIENGFATQLTPNYDLGAEVHNDLFNSPINYAFGIFNGATDAGSDDMDISDSGKDFVGRIFLQPFIHSGNRAYRKLGFGVGGSVGRHEGALPVYKTPGQQVFFSYTNGATASGLQYRIDPQLFYYWGPFGVLGEYIISSQTVKRPGSSPPTSALFDNHAWQVEASYFLTGDENSFRYSSRNPFMPATPFRFGGEGWGALELVARLGQLRLDSDIFPNFSTPAAARQATSWGVGLNWYLNSNVRLYFDFESTRLRGGSTAAGSIAGHDENAFLSRVQFSF